MRDIVCNVFLQEYSYSWLVSVLQGFVGSGRQCCSSVCVIG